MIVTSAANPGKERATRTENSTKNSSTGTEGLRPAHSHFSMLYTCSAPENLQTEDTQHRQNNDRKLD